MKRTIDSYFKATAADSSKNSEEKASSSPSAQLTELDEEENCVIESSNLLYVKSSAVKERHYNIKWEQKYKWLQAIMKKGPDVPTEDFLDKTVDLYAAKKDR